MNQLAREHNRRMVDIDPRVAPAAPLPDDCLLSLSRLAAGWVQSKRYDEYSYEALWGALCRHTVRFLVAGPNPLSDFDEVLCGALERIRALPQHTEDCAVTVTWPSLDTGLPAVLVRNGFAPLTALAVRNLHPGEDFSGRMPIRRAERTDVAWLADQATRLHRFESGLGALPERPGLRDRLHSELADAVETDLVLVSGQSGFVHGQPPRGAWIERQVAVGPAGYLSRLYVEPAARRGSVGRSLVAAAHEDLRSNGAEVVLLHHSVHNPVAAPMWAWLGYRPVLTTWTLRMARH